MSIENEDTGSALMKLVEAIAISPQDARAVVAQYEAQARASRPNADEGVIQKLVTDKIIKRYAKMAATSGGATSLAGVIPGFGTAVAMVGGGLADVSLCMKFQIDMTMCLGMAINKGISNEDAKHMSFIIALSGSLEQLGSSRATTAASSAVVNIIKENLKGANLQLVKNLFKQIGIRFTKKGAIKVIPLGVGVVIGSSANYALTKYVGRVARDVFLLHDDAQDAASAKALA